MTDTDKAKATNKKEPDAASLPKKKSRFKGQDCGEKLRHGKKVNAADKKSAGKLKSSVISQQMHQKLAQKNEDDNIGTDAVNRSSQIAEEGVSAGKDIGRKAVSFGNKLKSHGNDDSGESGKGEKSSEKKSQNRGAEKTDKAASGKAVSDEPGNGYGSKLHDHPLGDGANVSSANTTGKSYSSKLQFTEADTSGGGLKHTSDGGNETAKEGVTVETTRHSPGHKSTGSSEGNGSSAQGTSNPISRRIQKRKIQKSYVTGKGGPSGASAAGTAGKKSAKEKGKELLQQAGAFIKEHAGLFCVIGVFALIFCLLTTQLSSCSSMLSGGTGVVLGSSYTAEDDDILGADADYSAMKEDLREQIDRIEEDYPGYDEYQYSLAEINHNPYVLASYLTVLYEDYSREEVQSVLQDLFDRQYELTTREKIQIWTRTETRTGHRTVTNEDGTKDTEEYEYEVEVEYEYKILHVTLKNNTLEGIIDTSGVDNVKQERYALLNETLGNRSYLFGDDIYANPVPAADVPEYSIPGEALSDTRFARMVNEAEKYLGYPYVWGGSSPSTSFDCSGFVCWVINHSGNGWNYGRTTAEGLRQQLSIIPASEAKPGDIIFFQGTYNTSGASHVGIYVGNGMMIHCGNPIQYASINTSYWQSHFYCFGHLP